MKNFILLPFFGLLLFLLPLYGQIKTCNLYFDNAIPQVKFGIEEMKAELTKQGIKTLSNSVASFGINSDALSIVVTASAAEANAICKLIGGIIPAQKLAQSYSFREKRNGNNRTIVVLAGDANGAMYGALDIAEAIKLGALDNINNCDKTPFIENRGIKFNIPLDLRTPTYSDQNGASQQNIPEMWNMDFWKEFLDEMARNRYNLISLWSLHPFPSIVKVPEFPDVALSDVWRISEQGKKGVKGKGDVVTSVMLENHEVVRKISIDEKIKFWQDVMQYGHERGIAFYWFTWNIFTNGVNGKYGITDDQDNPATIAYLRASTRELILTYPLLVGIGITAGEHMQNLKGEYSNEKWLWKTYGEGVKDAQKIQPGRNIRMIHRFHMASQKEIMDEWNAYPGEFDFSFKYLFAHMYSSTKSVFIQPALEMLAPGKKLWLTVRNDDIYSFRWGDPDYAREFITSMPPASQLAGFYMGPDGYNWGREYLSNEPEIPRQLVMKKQWYSFMLWGRMSFDPTIPNAHFQKTLAVRFPDVSSDQLFRASSEASKIFPEITRFFWGDIDVKWFPEACISNGTFYNIRDFIMQVTMPGSGNLNIKVWREKKLGGKQMDGKTPLEVAASLQKYAQNTLKLLDELRKKPSDNKELRLTLGDYEAFAHIGNYYAEKILGAASIALYDTTKNLVDQASAIQHLEAALGHWEKYSAIYTKQYVQPVKYGRAGLVDIPGRLTELVAKDIEMAKNWQTGSIKGPLVGRVELNFKP